MKTYQLPYRLLRFSEQLYKASINERVNRFLIRAHLEGEEVDVHLHDPGRLKELIFPGNEIIIRRTSGIKTNFSVVAARAPEEFVFLDSRFHNYLAELILGKADQNEVKIGNSRIDLKYGNTLVEVKGCTLLKDDICLFPDAPSARASKQVDDLHQYLTKGGSAKVTFLCFRRIANYISINRETDRKLFESMRRAISVGLAIEGHSIYFEDDSLYYNGPINFDLSLDP